MFIIIAGTVSAVRATVRPSNVISCAVFTRIITLIGRQIRLVISDGINFLT